MLWLDLEGAVNVRDVGGIPTDDGEKIARGRLLRSDNLQNLSPTDVNFLVEHVRLSTVVDLRSPAEVTSEGPAPLTRIDRVLHVNHSLLPEHGFAATAEALLVRRKREKERYPGDPSCAHYLGYVEHRPDSIVAALRAVNRSAGAALVHCAAGKDRTGVVVAFALTVAGARREDIIRDYAATGERLDRILDRLRSSPTYAGSIDSVPEDHHRPRAETMEAFLEQVDKRHGGVLNVLGSNGFTDDEFDALHRKLRR
ncbi:tyrosine-protein phosphatase [Saccharomonospora xinjiangensis]|uniref:tyrosine-protein phosphatase n=1 Tax=Saccharomonospora xinjiangensis TaxID=75294 RepID=UPI00106F86AD|nr:tyrosine-protein phosphatase [Saccharomonospora xinjiangensis]QBQ59998.1 Tyrosine-protein phosphatase precursor [Saccharomonospora xinjiangensis]